MDLHYDALELPWFHKFGYAEFETDSGTALTTDLQELDNSADAHFDDGVRCLRCEYNLTGLNDGPCPECGMLFEREKLLAYHAGAPAPVPIWGERKEVGTSAAYIRTLFAVWFHPINFARRFPLNPVAREPVIFARITLAIAMLLVLAPPIIFTSPSPMDIVSVMVMCVWGPVCVNICERLSTVILLMSPEGEHPTDDMHVRSLGLVRMTRAFLLHSAVLISIASIGSIVLTSQWDSWKLARVGCPIALVYWWVCMTCIAAAYRRSVWNVIIAIVLLPVVAAISIGLVFALMMVIAGAMGP